MHKHFSSAASLAALGLMLACSAHAQVAGTYEGSTAQGLPVSIFVSGDAQSGFQVWKTEISWAPSCKVAPSPFSTIGFGYAPVDAFIVAGSFSQQATGFTNFWQKVQFTVTNGGTRLEGSLKASEPEFTYRDGASTNKVQLCQSGNQAFTADWVAPPPLAARAAAAHAMPAARGGVFTRVVSPGAAPR